MNDDVKNKCFRSALSSLGKPEQERLELINRIMGHSDRSVDVLREMDDMIRFADRHLAYLYNKCIMRMPAARFPDKFERYHSMIDHWTQEEYPWMDESSKSSMIGKLSYR